MKRYSVYVTPVCDGGSKLMADVDLVRFAVVVDGGTTAFGRSFGSWAKLRMELLSATTGFSVGFTQFTATVRALHAGRRDRKSRQRSALSALYPYAIRWSAQIMAEFWMSL